MRTALLASLALLAGCGGPLFFAEVEDKKICLVLHGESIEGVPAALDPLLPRTAHWEGDLDVGKDVPGLDSKGTTGTIKMLSITLKSTTDMSKITEASVAVSDESGSLEHLASYAQQPPIADPSVIAMTVDSDMNLFDRLRSGGTIHYSMELTGTPPTESWTSDITTCMSVKLTVDALEAMKN